MFFHQNPTKYATSLCAKYVRLSQSKFTLVILPTMYFDDLPLKDIFSQGVKLNKRYVAPFNHVSDV